MSSPSNISFREFTTPHALHSYNFETNKEKLVTEDAFKKTASFTKQTLHVIGDPRYSLFVMGVGMIRSDRDDDGDDWFAGLGTAMGAVMIMASPIALALKVGVGIPVAVGSAIGTGVTGIAYGIEKAAKKGNEATIKKREVKAQRKDLTKKFVVRMHERLKGLSENTREFFKENPGELIAIAAIAVAFTSRDLYDNSLRGGGEILKKEDIADQDEERQRYFTSLCEMKHFIQNLNPSLDNRHAWDYLMKAFDGLNSDEIKESDSNRQMNIKLLMKEAHKISDHLLDDPIFQKEWQRSLDKLL